MVTSDRLPKHLKTKRNKSFFCTGIGTTAAAMGACNGKERHLGTADIAVTIDRDGDTLPSKSQTADPKGPALVEVASPAEVAPATTEVTSTAEVVPVAAEKAEPATIETEGAPAAASDSAPGPCTPPPSVAAPRARAQSIAYISDVEGNWEYFLSFLEISSGMTLDSLQPDGSATISLADGWHFVFGGDSCDKGGEVGGSVRFVKSLFALKRRYPDRVTLLLGNRDLNKMRLTSELAPAQLELLSEVPGPSWVPAAKQVGPEKFLRKELARLQVQPARAT